MLDSIGEKAFIANRAHFHQGTMHAGGQKVSTKTCQGRRLGSAEHVGRNREIELIDQAPLQQSAKKRWSAFARESAHVIFSAQSFQHGSKIDLVGFSEMQSGFLFERRLSLLWHSRRRKNKDR